MRELEGRISRSYERKKRKEITASSTIPKKKEKEKEKCQTCYKPREQIRTKGHVRSGRSVARSQYKARSDRQVMLS